MVEDRIETFKPDLDSVFEVDDYLYFYSDILTLESTNVQVDFLRRELALDNTAEVLDLACGYGRHSNLLASLGCSVSGIDSSAEFLEIAKSDGIAKGVKVKYMQQDMRELALIEKFDCILMLFTSFGIFADEDNETVINGISRALKSGGQLCLDIPNRDAVFRHWYPYMVRRKGNDFMIDSLKYDVVTGRMNNHRVVIRDGVIREKPFFIRLYSFTELRALLAQSGLKVSKAFADWNGSELREDSRRMVIIAKKD